MWYGYKPIEKFIHLTFIEGALLGITIETVLKSTAPVPPNNCCQVFPPREIVVEQPTGYVNQFLADWLDSQEEADR